MNLTPRAMADDIASTGFGAEPLEKVFRLMALLDALNSHPFLKSRIALKGGTALNLFHFEVPRLSVDIDLNYIGAADRKTMLAEKPEGRAGDPGRVLARGAEHQARPDRPRRREVATDLRCIEGRPGQPRAGRQLPSAHAALALRNEGLPPGRFAAYVPGPPAGPSRAGRREARGAPRPQRHPRRLRRACDSSARPASTSRSSVSASSSTVGSTAKTGGRYPRPMSRPMSTWCNESWSPCCGPIALPLDATSQPGPTGWSPSVASASRWCSPSTSRELEFLRRLNEEGEIAADLLTSDPIMQATLREHPGARVEGPERTQTPRPR